MDVIMDVKFEFENFRAFEVNGGQSLPFPIDFARGPYSSAALLQCLWYRIRYILTYAHTHTHTHTQRKFKHWKHLPFIKYNIIQALIPVVLHWAARHKQFHVKPSVHQMMSTPQMCQWIPVTKQHS